MEKGVHEGHEVRKARLLCHTPQHDRPRSLVESITQSVSQLFHGPAPRSPLHRLAVRLRHSRSNTSTEKPLMGNSISDNREERPARLLGRPSQYLPRACYYSLEERTFKRNYALP